MLTAELRVTRLVHPKPTRWDYRLAKPTGKWKIVWDDDKCDLFIEVTCTKMVKEKVGEKKVFNNLFGVFFSKPIYEMVSKPYTYFAHENSLKLTVTFENECGNKVKT